MRQQGLRRGQQADDIDIELPPDLVQRGRLQRAIGAVAGVVQQHVNLAEPGQAGFNRSGNRCGIQHIEPGDQHAVKAGEFSFQRRSAHGGNHVPAFGLKVSCGGFANAA